VEPEGPDVDDQDIRLYRMGYLQTRHFSQKGGEPGGILMINRQTFQVMVEGVQRRRG
jgi:hypothetical protein